MYSIKKIIKNFISIFLIISCLASNLNAQTWDWIQTVRPGGNEYCWDITTDKPGNVLVIGRVKGNSTFGSGAVIQSPPFISCCETDMFLAKYRNNGTLVWVKRDGGKQADWGRAVACDMQSNTYVTGDYSDTANFGTHQIIGLGAYNNRNIFLAKYDSLGTCLWAKSAGNTTSEAKGFGVAVDSSGNSYLTGFIGNVGYFDGKPIGSAGRSCCFAAKFDPNGNCIWTKTIAGYYGSTGHDIKVKDGDLLVTGDYRGTLYVGTNTYPGSSTSWSDVFVTKMDTAGNFKWTATAVGEYQDQANSVEFDKNGDVYISGTFANDLTFGTVTINSVGTSTNATTANGKADVFLAKYNKNGIFQWVKTIGNSWSGAINPNDASSDDIEITNSNKILICGYIIGNVNMAGIPLALDTTHESSYVTVFDTLGNVLWYKLSGGDPINGSASVARGVSRDKYDNLFICGEFYSIPGPANYDSISVGSYSGWDGLIGKLMPPLNPSVFADYTVVCPSQNIIFSMAQEGYPLTYQWDFPGGSPASSTAASSVVNYPVPGTYTATATITNGHGSAIRTLTINVTSGACTTVPEYVNNINISITPNPLISQAAIHINGLNINAPLTFQLYNYLGQEIKGILLTTIADNTVILNTETIAPGGYFLNIIQNNSILKTEKLIIYK